MNTKYKMCNKKEADSTQVLAEEVDDINTVTTLLRKTNKSVISLAKTF